MALIIIAFLAPAAALALIVVTSSKKKSTSTERVDFIAQAASHIHGAEDEYKAEVLLIQRILTTTMTSWVKVFSEIT